MKKIIMLGFIILGLSIFCSPVFASGGIELKLINKTGSQVEEIILVDTKSGKEKIIYSFLEKNASVIIKVIKGAHYNVFMIDANRHKYGILDRRWTKGRNELEISHKNFIHQDVASTLRRMIGR